MATIQENRTTWSAHDWISAGAEWSSPWGSVEQQWAHTFYSRIVAFLPARSILEIATGYGRWTRFLIRDCDQFYGIDIVENCVQACRDRYGLAGQFFLTDGKTIPPAIPANSIDFAFSADSLVHVDEEVIRSYLHELLRVLSPEGVAFLHHSNFADTPEGTRNPHWRDSSTSAARVREHCRHIGLFCLSQELLNWGQDELNDCFSLIGKSALWETRIVHNQGFSTEMAHARALTSLYHPQPLP
jgi:SAM-dependent methyltransferase